MHSRNKSLKMFTKRRDSKPVLLRHKKIVKLFIKNIKTRVEWEQINRVICMPVGHSFNFRRKGLK